MLQKVFTIYDDKAKAYLPPFFLPEMGQAIRAFTDCVNDPTHMFGKHPSDYTLFCAGTFNDSSGVFELEAMLLVVAHGIDLKEVPLRNDKQGEIAFGTKRGGSV